MRAQPWKDACWRARALRATVLGGGPDPARAPATRPGRPRAIRHGPVRAAALLRRPAGLAGVPVRAGPACRAGAGRCPHTVRQSVRRPGRQPPADGRAGAGAALDLGRGAEDRGHPARSPAGGAAGHPRGSPAPPAFAPMPMPEGTTTTRYPCPIRATPPERPAPAAAGA
jgi:hypothetical protein